MILNKREKKKKETLMVHDPWLQQAFFLKGKIRSKELKLGFQPKMIFIVHLSIILSYIKHLKILNNQDYPEVVMRSNVKKHMHQILTLKKQVPDTGWH